ncbi:uncharacterized protein BDCG_09051 [Blastomyces dermatitidis ER-3]|uniref:Uncharacterized protein n=2 Tax=Ajellomyces dermatitidis TaxID=5039 RepID=F2TM17_AJEDA|nr:uncharacterized protein BDCG_09051 [Blastomyces dermatitidis ER-3]EEQ85782.2 hypothetical protein BDCG_09051 [Blastomyces dermatitidis ER-3]EGE84280.2 hypothetical protein BDDG_07225 [Blastomyces dermatitidis ATCC 18188]
MDKDIHEELPYTAGVFMGNVIRNCWHRGGYQRMQDVCSALSELSERHLSGLVLSTMTGNDSRYRSFYVDGEELVPPSSVSSLFCPRGCGCGCLAGISYPPPRFLQSA